MIPFTPTQSSTIISFVDGCCIILCCLSSFSTLDSRSLMALPYNAISSRTPNVAKFVWNISSEKNLLLLFATSSTVHETLVGTLPVCAWCDRVPLRRSHHLQRSETSSKCSIESKLLRNISSEKNLLLLFATSSTVHETLVGILPVCAWCDRVPARRSHHRQRS